MKYLSIIFIIISILSLISYVRIEHYFFPFSLAAGTNDLSASVPRFRTSDHFVLSAHVPSFHVICGFSVIVKQNKKRARRSFSSSLSCLNFPLNMHNETSFCSSSETPRTPTLAYSTKLCCQYSLIRLILFLQSRFVVRLN